MLAIEDKKVVRLLQVLIWGLLAFLGLFFLRIHWVRAYSDPVGWVDRSILFYERGSLPRLWSVVYPLYLYWPLQLLGPHYVYISNLPWLIAMVALLGGVSARQYRGSGHADRARALLYCLWTMLVMVFLGWRVMGELINPYREAVAFSLLLAAFYVVVGPRGLRVWRAGVAGLLFGVSVAMREPHILALPALLLVLLYWLYGKLPNRAWTYLPTMIGGVLVGLLPFFIQNQVSGGYWWVPVYLVPNMEPIIERFDLHSVFIVQPWIFALVGFVVVALGTFLFRHFALRPPLTVAQRKKYWRWCYFVLVALLLVLTVMLVICLYRGIIPHMDMHRFKRVGPRTLRHLRGQWGSLGVFLLAVGVLGMVVRKEWRLLAITVPTGLLFLFFWSFYSYVKPRYVFSVQIFAYPVIAYGIHSVVLWTSAIVSASWVRKHVPIGSVIVALIALLAQLGTIAVRGNESLKVWQMPAIRRVFADVLEEPVVFDCARRRHTRLLASIFASRKSSLVNHWRHNSFSIHWGEVFAKGDLDTGLGDRFREILEDLAVHNIYDYGVRRLPVRYWLDRVPVIDLGTVAGRLDLYGRVMDDYLHKLEPWSHTSFSHSLEAYPVDEPLLLGLDFYRLWDYDDRTFWRVSAGGFTNDLPRKNHFIWQPLPVAAAREDLVIASDAGLPIDPHVAVFRLNDPITILFGVDGDYWYRNYLDVGFAENRHLMHASAILLMDQGRVQVPVFADEGHDVYMSLRVVFYQQEPFYGGRHHMQVSDGENRVQVTLPGRHVGADVYFPLGVGRGAFELRDIELRTSLPSMHKQIENRRAGKAQNFEYASISSMRIFALPRKLPARFVFRAEADYSPWVQDGIGLYGIETSEQGSFVWMKPEASIVLPAAKHEGVYKMSVTTVAHRPVEFPAEPQWVWNGVAVQPTRREPGAAENVTIYHFDAVVFRGADQNVLQVIANEWIPRRDSDIPDGRSLGIGFVEMAWQRSM